MKLLSLARDLRRRKARERQQCFVAEGVRSVEALLQSPLTVQGLLVTDDLSSDERGAAVRSAAEARGIPVREVTREELESAASTESPQGILCRSLAANSKIAGCACVMAAFVPRSSIDGGCACETTRGDS